MPKFIIKKQTNIVQEFYLDPDKKYTSIGSGKENDLVLQDSSVAVDHLFIEKQQDGYYVEDMGSRFGTILNEKKIMLKTKLDDGDRISIGEHTLIFRAISSELDKRPKEGAGEPVKTPEKVSGLDKRELSTSDTEKSKADNKESTEKNIGKDTDKLLVPVASQGPVSIPTIAIKLPKRHYLIAISGPYFGKKYALNFDKNIIGRDTDLCNIIIGLDNKGELDASISRLHATVFFKQGQFFISDKRSQGRTYVNRKKLSQSSEIPLNTKDEIEIVSDKKNTIFRLVEEGDWRFAPPKHSGSWWVRRRRLLSRLFSILTLLVCMFFLYNAGQNFRTLSQIPTQLSVTSEPWALTQGITTETNRTARNKGLQLLPTPLLSDFSQDGSPDLIYVDQNGGVSGYDGKTHEKLWPTFSDALAQLPLSPALADMNGDGVQDIIIATRDSRIVVLSGVTGKEIWSSDLLGGELSTTPLVGDFDGNNEMDVVVCSKDGSIFFGKSLNGEMRWNHFDQGHSINSIPSSADIDGDGVLEIFIGNDNAEVLVFDGHTNAIKQTISLAKYFGTPRKSQQSRLRNHIGLGDITGDKIIDIVIATPQGNAVALDGLNMEPIWIQQFPISRKLRSFYHPGPVLCDLTGDNILDVVLVTTDGNIRSYNGINDESNYMIWEMSIENESFMSSPSLADINKDGLADIVLSGTSGTLYFLNGKTGQSLWTKAESTSPGFGITPVIADINGNENMNIVCAGFKQNEIFSLEMNTKVFKGTILWEQLANNSAHTGVGNIGKEKSVYLFTIFSTLFVTCFVLGLNFFLKKKGKRLIELSQ